MPNYKLLSDKITREIKLKTKPVAVKIIKHGDTGIQGRMLKPARDLGSKLTLCQMIGLSRYQGLSIMAELEDMACPGTMLIFGMIKPPGFIKEGALSHGLYTETREAAVRLDLSMPILREGAKGIVTASLDHASFDPDVIVFYGTPSQLLKLVAAYVYKHGEPVKSESYAKAGSDLAILSSYLDGKPRLFLPGLGDRIVGRVEEYEMGFTLPASLLEGVAEAVEEQSRTGFIVYPPKPILVYPVDFASIPVIGKYYKEMIDKVDELARK